MGVVLATEQIGGREAKLGKARAIGAATYDVIIGFDPPARTPRRQFNRAMSCATSNDVAILFAVLAADTRSRLVACNPRQRPRRMSRFAAAL